MNQRLRRGLIRIVCLAAALCLAVAARGQAAQTGALTLEQCVALALERHPLIHASGHREEAAVARIRQAAAFPFPSIDFNSDLQPHFGDFVNSEEAYFGVSQTLELARKRTARKRIAEQESREVVTDTDLVTLDVILLVRQAFYELLLAQENLSYARLDLELTKEFLDQTELKLEAGDVAQVEVLRARVEALTAENAVRAAESDVTLGKARLNYHLARGEREPIDVVGQLEVPFADLDLEQLQAEAIRLRPEMARLRASLEREKYVQQDTRLSSLPDPDFNMSRHWVEGYPTTWSFTVSVPLPFLFQRRQKAELAESFANVLALESEAEQAANTIRVEVEETYQNALKTQRQISLYQTGILPQAQDVLEMLSFSYQEGEIGGFELIEARRTLNEARRWYAESLFAYAVTLASLDRAIGRRP